MSRILRAAVVLLFFSVFLSLGFYIWWQDRIKPVLAPASPAAGVSLVIRPGDSAAAVIASLADRGLLRSSLSARIYFRLYGSQNWIRPGSYVLSPSLSVPDIFAVLSRGPADIWVTIPEGWRREQISARLASTLPDFDSAAFASASAGLEGWLFPDTYLIPAKAAAPDIVSLFLANLRRKTGLDPDRPADWQTLIIASLIEREAAQSPDRELISGIIRRRLDSDWPLQIDATVQYAAASRNCGSAAPGCDWWPPVADTAVPSLFNTYLHPGLPPAPICNPGQAAVTAARSPAASPYWYYLTGTDGVTYYAVTFAQHQSNIDKYLRH